MSPPRSSHVYDRDAWKLVFNATRQQKWLEEKGPEVECLVDLCYTNTRHMFLTFDLLSRFAYLDRAKVRAFNRAIYEKVIGDWKLVPKDTAFVAKLQKDGGTDSSQAVVNLLRELSPEDWTGRNFRTDLKMAVLDDSITNLVLVDDFSGTGRSLRTFVEDVKKIDASKRKKIYSCFYCAMKETFDSIPESLEDLFVLQTLSRGISDHFPEAEAQEMKRLMVEIEENFEVRPRYSLGFEGSETLFAREHSPVPNNVFPIFWERLKDRKRGHRPLFRRLGK